MRSKIDSKLQDTACYNDCFYKMKQMVRVIEVNKKDVKDLIQLQIQDVKDSDSVADSDFSFLFSRC